MKWKSSKCYLNPNPETYKDFHKTTKINNPQFNLSNKKYFNFKTTLIKTLPILLQTLTILRDQKHKVMMIHKTKSIDNLSKEKIHKYQD